MKKLATTQKKLSTTQLSSRGQLVIPEFIRKNMVLEAGDQFIVFAQEDVIILKKIEIYPTIAKLGSFLSGTQEQHSPVSEQTA